MKSTQPRRAAKPTALVKPSRASARHSSLQAALLAWFDRHRRSLPWRGTRDPYRIWVSEVMLQQTRIEVVVPAYRRFLRAFPTMAKLAVAREEAVLAAWSGLGYYKRARALHRAARLLCERGERTFPRRPDAALTLPGVGSYTAAAVLSIAYDEAHAAVDGNIARVLSRWRRLEADAKRAQATADELLDRDRPGDWNQALMELGQTICTPRSPRCDACPVSRWCAARRDGVVEHYPAPKRRRRTEQHALRLAVVRDARGGIVLERGVFPHLKHMWLPLTLGPGDGERHDFRHAIVHRQFRVRVEARTAGRDEIRRLLAVNGGVERRLFTPDEMRGIGRSSLLTKALAHV